MKSNGIQGDYVFIHSLPSAGNNLNGEVSGISMDDDALHNMWDTEVFRYVTCLVYLKLWTLVTFTRLVTDYLGCKSFSESFFLQPSSPLFLLHQSFINVLSLPLFGLIWASHGSCSHAGSFFHLKDQ